MAKNDSEVGRQLVAELERRSGRRIRSREDIAAYLDELSRNAAEKNVKRRTLKNLLLAALLIGAAGQYYFIDVQVQILTQQSLQVFVPVRDVARARPQRISESLAGLEAARKPPAPRSLAL